MVTLESYNAFIRHLKHNLRIWGDTGPETRRRMCVHASTRDYRSSQYGISNMICSIRFLNDHPGCDFSNRHQNRQAMTSLSRVTFALVPVLLPQAVTLTTDDACLHNFEWRKNCIHQWFWFLILNFSLLVLIIIFKRTFWHTIQWKMVTRPLLTLHLLNSWRERNKDFFYVLCYTIIL